MPGNGAGSPAGGRHPGADPLTGLPISELIRQARRARGMSQEQLARRLAELTKDPYATRELVARWERGRRIPGPYWRETLSRALDLPLDRLERAAAAARLRRALTAATTRPAARDATDAAAGP